jgi:hypothetical protein
LSTMPLSASWFTCSTYTLRLNGSIIRRLETLSCFSLRWKLFTFHAETKRFTWQFVCPSDQSTLFHFLWSSPKQIPKTEVPWNTWCSRTVYDYENAVFWDNMFLTWCA